jgi:hypothetical protein
MALVMVHLELANFVIKTQQKYQLPMYLIKLARKERGKNDTYYGSF